MPERNQHPENEHQQPSGATRRQFLRGAGTAGAAGVAGLTVMGLGGCAEGAQTSDIRPGQGSAEPGDNDFLAEARVPFDGPHQAGVDTPQQSFIKLIAFNLKDSKTSREDVIRLMRLWTDDARRMCSGLAGLADLEPESLESTANLTITVGYGRSLLDKIGLSDKAPEWLGDLPEFSRDELVDAWNGGDICLQICADDRFTLSHAARFMTKTARTYVNVAWMQDGFLHARGSIEPGTTPRNLFGQLDGTANPAPDEHDDIIWINDGPEWLRGGTAMVIRRVAMLMDEWDILDRASREVAMGRTIDTGAPLTGTDEFDDPDFEALDQYGLPVIDPNSHMARAFSTDRSERIYRRPYNYDMPPGPDTRGTSNSGQIFICFQKNPLKQFVPIQQRLDEADRLNEWITHIGSAVFAVPHGTNEGDYWGQDLLEG